MSLRRTMLDRVAKMRKSTTWLTRRVRDSAGQLAETVREAARLTPTVIRKPPILGHWVLRAHWAQLALLLSVLTLPSLLPSAADALMEEFYPPVVTKKFFGLVRRAEQDPRLETRRKQVRVAMWTGAGGVVVFLLWLSIPKAVRRTSHLARQLEREADHLVATHPSRSVLLYRRALALASDPGDERGLQGKMNRLDARMSGLVGPGSVNGTEAGDTAEGRTVVLEGQAASTPDPAADNRRVGPAGRYRLERELGRGAGGIVYRAHDEVLARDIALKELSAHLSHDPRFLRRFQEEARALARLTHPHIVQVYDFVENDGRSWIAMELVDGEDLDRFLRRRGRLPIDQVLGLGASMADALGYAHHRGVLHRDFKPANVLLNREQVPKVTDFGLAKLAQSSVHTQQGAVLGTPAYMSPEQASGGDIGPASDMYALGVTLYTMLTGRLPFEGEVTSVIAQLLTRDPVPLREHRGQIPVDLEALVMSMLSKQADSRPQSMNEVVGCLEGIARGPAATGGEIEGEK